MKHALAFFLVCTMGMSAQPLCPPDEPGCPWQTSSVVLTLLDPDCFATVQFKWRICNGRLEIAVDEANIIPAAGCQGWDRLQLYHYNYSGLLDYITQAMLTRFHANPDELPGTPNPPRCGEGTLSTASVYTANCGIWLKCDYYYQGDVQANCEYQGTDPNWDPINKKITTWKWFACGQTCCQREYEICWRYDPIQGFYQIYPIRLLGKHRLIECTGQSQFPRPCEDGC